MRFPTTLWTHFGVTAALAGLAISPRLQAQSNDVYNFYFQKGSAPGQVIQGGGGQTAGPTPLSPAPLPPPPPSLVQPITPTPEAAQVTTTAKAAAPEVPDSHAFKRFDVLLGATSLNDQVGRGWAYTFGGQYNLNRYFGVRAQGQILATESATYTQTVGDINDGSNKWGGQAALVFTPLHMELLGHQLLKVSALGGVISRRKFGDVTSFDGVNSAYSVNRMAEAFWGVAAQLALNENFGVEASIAMLDGGKVGQATADLVLSF